MLGFITLPASSGDRQDCKSIAFLRMADCETSSRPSHDRKSSGSRGGLERDNHRRNDSSRTSLPMRPRRVLLTAMHFNSAAGAPRRVAHSTAKRAPRRKSYPAPRKDLLPDLARSTNASVKTGHERAPPRTIHARTPQPLPVACPSLACAGGTHSLMGDKQDPCGVLNMFPRPNRKTRELIGAFDALNVGYGTAATTAAPPPR